MFNPVPPSDDRAAQASATHARRFRHYGDELEHEAASWAVRRLRGLDPADEARLQAWLDADPRHGHSLDALSSTLEDVRRLPEPMATRLRQSIAPRRQKRRTSGAMSLWGACFRLGVPHAVAALVAATVLGAAGWSWWKQPTFQQAYTTDRGQQMVATLPDDETDGSSVQLDTATRVQATLFRNRREVELLDGQAMFSVHADQARPFHVMAGGLRITVMGTRFSVRHTSSGVDAGRTTIAVEEGHVRVASMEAKATPGTGSSVIDLRAGQMLVGDGTGGVGRVAAIAPASVAQWRSGRVSFDQTPLAQAIAEFERYGNTGLIVRDPAVAALPVGGSYSLRQHERFVEFLPKLLPVRLVRRNGSTEVVAR